MEIDSEQWQAMILEGAAKLDVSVHAAQVRLFARHALELIHWNRKINLTAIVEPDQLAVKHFLDSIAAIHCIPDTGRLIDVGSGGGFPGIPLKVLRPAQPMTLVDSVRKKVTFIKHLIRHLELANIAAVHARAEALTRLAEYKAGFAAVVSRAVAEPVAMIRMTADLLAADGRIILYQGPHGPAAGDAAAAQVADLGFHIETIDYRLPFSDDRRKLTILYR